MTKVVTRLRELTFEVKMAFAALLAAIVLAALTPDQMLAVADFLAKLLNLGDEGQGIVFFILFPGLAIVIVITFLIALWRASIRQ